MEFFDKLFEDDAATSVRFSDVGAGAFNFFDEINWENSADVEAANFPSAAVSESSLASPNVGLNLKEKIQNNSLETDESHEQVTAPACELSEPEKQSGQTPDELVPLRAISQHSPNGGLNSNEKITVETDEPIESEVREQNAAVEQGVDDNKQVPEMHDRQQRKSINKLKEIDTHQTKCARKATRKRKNTSVVWLFFRKVEENGVERAKCPDCDQLLSWTSETGTSNLHRHRCFKDWRKDAIQQLVSKSTSVVWLFFRSKVQENGVERTKCPGCDQLLSGTSENGTSNLDRHRCFKDWMKDATQQLVSKGADAPPQTKRSKLVAKVGEREEDEERGEEETSTDSTVNVVAEEQDPIVPDIGQAAVSGLVHDQVQDDYTTKETIGRGLKDQEHRLLSHRIIELLPTETQSSGQQANNMAIDGTGGLPQVGRTQIEGGIIATSTTSSIPTVTSFPVLSATSELRSFLSQSPQALLSPTEIDRCSLLNAAIDATSNEWEKTSMREVLAEVRSLEEAISTCPSSSRSDTLPLQGYENLASTISQSTILPYNSEVEIASQDDQAAQLERQLKAINEKKAQKKLKLILLEKAALQYSQATVIRIKIDNIMPALFELVKSVLPKP